MLKRCIQIHPSEPLFHYMSARWAHAYLVVQGKLSGIPEEFSEALNRLVHDGAARAMQIDPDWSEPRKLLSRSRGK